MFLLLGLLLAIGTGFYNIGIIALDDYSNEIRAMIPAQMQTPLSILVNEGVHPPVARVALRSLTQVLLSIGVEDPVWQLRISLALLAIVIFVSTASFVLRLTRSLASEVRETAAFLIAFYFASPLFFSRPMVESLAIPFLLGSCALAHDYQESGRRRSLFASLSVLAVGCLFRPQLGACAPVLFLLPLLKRRYIDAVALFGVGLAAIVGTGLVDVALGREFHASLRRYAEYNQSAGEWHGTSPFYVLPLLFVALSLPPALFSRYKGFDWRGAYRPLFTVGLFFVAFLVVHSAFPHKEERFMIPVLPLFLLLLTPLLAHFRRVGNRWRLAYFHAINGLLLVLVVTQVPQANSIELVRAVDKLPGVTKVYSLEDSIVLFPNAYGLRAKQMTTEGVSRAQLVATTEWSCDRPLVVRFDKSDFLLSVEMKNRFTRRAVFPPGLIERALIRTNPAHNLRRGQLELWLPAHCP